MIVCAMYNGQLEWLSGWKFRIDSGVPTYNTGISLVVIAFVQWHRFDKSQVA